VRKHRGDDDEEDDGKRKRHKKHGAAARNPITQAAVWLDVAGEVVARRTLTYDGGGAGGPPMSVLRRGVRARRRRLSDGGFDSLEGSAGLGLYADLGYRLQRRA